MADKKKYKSKVRLPVAPPSEVHQEKKKYQRKEKHRQDWSHTGEIDEDDEDVLVDLAWPTGDTMEWHK